MADTLGDIPITHGGLCFEEMTAEGGQAALDLVRLKARLALYVAEPRAEVVARESFGVDVGAGMLRGIADDIERLIADG